MGLLVAAVRSERQLAEGALRRLAESQRTLAEAQRLTNLGSFECDIRTEQAIWSDELYRILGRDPGECPATYKSWRASIVPEDQPAVDAAISAAYEQGIPQSSLHRIVRPDGSQRTVECRFRVEVDQAGKPVRMLGTGQDVTAVQLAEERFRALFQDAPYALMVFDAEGRIALANSQSEHLFGYTRHALIGQFVEGLVPSIRSLRRGEPSEPTRSATQLELRARRADGHEFPIEVSLTPLSTEHGTMISAAIRDVTEVKEAAAALAHQATHDALTGLPNRTLFVDRLEQGLHRARRSARKLAVVFVDLDDFKVAATVARILESTGLEPELLALELAESTLLQDEESASRVLRELKAIGVSLVRDDFGSGYHSITNLTRLTIDGLKLDRSFIGGIGDGGENEAIISAVLSMASALEVGVTAAGVETAEQLSRLRSHGCEFAQGFLLARPASADQVGALLDNEESEGSVGSLRAPVSGASGREAGVQQLHRLIGRIARVQ